MTVKNAAAALAALLSLAAFTPPDAPQPGAGELPCTSPAARLSNSKAFSSPYNSARRLMDAKQYREGLNLTRTARENARSQMEVLSVVMVETAAYFALGDEAGIVLSLREEERLTDLCPGLLPESVFRSRAEMPWSYVHRPPEELVDFVAPF